MKEQDIYSIFEELINHSADAAMVEYILASHPNEQAELRALLDLKVEIDISKPLAPDQNTKIRTRNQVLAAIKSTSVPNKVRPTFQLHMPGWFSLRLQKLAVTSLVVTSVLFSSGTGLVQAASNSLPGDNLYPVKRSWEGVQLFLVTDQITKAALQNTFEQERVNEIEELYLENRAETVSFNGTLQKIDKNVWTIEGVMVMVDPSLANASIFKLGDLVSVIGTTDDGVIKAEQILFAAKSNEILPTLQPTIEATEQPEDTPTYDGNNETSSENSSNTELDEGSSESNTSDSSESNSSEEDSSTGDHESFSTPQPNDGSGVDSDSNSDQYQTSDPNLSQDSHDSQSNIESNSIDD